MGLRQMDLPSTNFIKLYRSSLKHSLWKDLPTWRVFEYCILKANWNTDYKTEYIREYQIDLERGQLVTSYRNISEDCGITFQQVRTGIKRLISEKMLTSQSTHRFTILTVCNYSTFQPPKKESNTAINTSIRSNNKYNNLSRDYYIKTNSNISIEESKKLSASGQKFLDSLREKEHERD